MSDVSPVTLQTPLNATADLDSRGLSSQEPETFFIDVDALQEAGISAADIQKLRGAGFATVTGV